jgi:hypothetical protein
MMTKQEYHKLKNDVAKLYGKTGLTWNECLRLDRIVDVAYMDHGNLTAQERIALRNVWR